MDGHRTGHPQGTRVQNPAYRSTHRHDRRISPGSPVCSGNRPSASSLIEMADSELRSPDSANQRPLQRIAFGAARLVLRACTLVSPRPATGLVRRVFSAGGAKQAQRLALHVPDGVDCVVSDEPYGEHPDERLDVYAPSGAVHSGLRLPVVLWVHGGGWVGGSKQELEGWFRIVAAHGFTVVAPCYSLAPDARFPVPLRQLLLAWRHVSEHAERLGADPDRVVFAGDSAGAQLAAQLAAAMTNPAYAELAAVDVSQAPAPLRGVVLCCGPHDLRAFPSDGPLSDVERAVFWAYSGRRHYRDDSRFVSAMSVVEHIAPGYPPAFVTAGNADPLEPQSRSLVAALRASGVEVDALLWAADHAPGLGHEYQFDLELDEGRVALERIVAFVRTHTGE